MSMSLHRTTQAVNDRISVKKLRLPNLQKRYWKNKDDNYVIENYGKIKSTTIAKKLGRSVKAVGARARFLKNNSLQGGQCLTLTKKLSGN